MNPHQEAVREFHEMFQLTNNKAPRVPCESDKKLRINLIKEEAKELRVAIEQRDMVEIVDALGDLLYVVYGAAITYGLDMSDWNVVKDVLRLDEKRPLPFGGIPSMLQDEVGLKCAGLMDERVNLYTHYALVDHMEGISESLNKLLNACYRIGLAYGVAMDKPFMEIHRSNMTKLWTEEEFHNMDLEFLKARRCEPDDIVGAKTACGKWLVKRKDDGKVIKSPSYSPASLEPILKELSKPWFIPLPDEPKKENPA